METEINTALAGVYGVIDRVNCMQSGSLGEVQKAFEGTAETSYALIMKVQEWITNAGFDTFQAGKQQRTSNQAASHQIRTTGKRFEKGGFGAVGEQISQAIHGHVFQIPPHQPEFHDEKPFVFGTESDVAVMMQTMLEKATNTVDAVHAAIAAKFAEKGNKHWMGCCTKLEIVEAPTEFPIGSVKVDFTKARSFVLQGFFF